MVQAGRSVQTKATCLTLYMQHAHSRAQIHLMHRFHYFHYVLGKTYMYLSVPLNTRHSAFLFRRLGSFFNASGRSILKEDVPLKTWNVLVGTGLVSKKHPSLIKYIPHWDKRYKYCSSKMLLGNQTVVCINYKLFVTVKPAHTASLWRIQPTNRKKEFPIKGLSTGINWLHDQVAATLAASL